MNDMNYLTYKDIYWLWNSLEGGYIDQNYPYEFVTYEKALRAFISTQSDLIAGMILETERIIKNNKVRDFIINTNFKTVNPQYQDSEIKRFLKIFEDLKNEYQKMKEEGLIYRGSPKE